MKYCSKKNNKLWNIKNGWQYYSTIYKIKATYQHIKFYHQKKKKERKN